MVLLARACVLSLARRRSSSRQEVARVAMSQTNIAERTSSREMVCAAPCENGAFHCCYEGSPQW